MLQLQSLLLQVRQVIRWKIIHVLKMHKKPVSCAKGSKWALLGLLAVLRKTVSLP